MKKIDFYFDFASPNAYLSHKVIKEIKEKNDVEVNYIPVLLGEYSKLQTTNHRWNNFLESKIKMSIKIKKCKDLSKGMIYMTLK